MIKKAAEGIGNAVLQLKKYWAGVDKPIKTRIDYFNDNCLGGIFKQMIIVIVGVSGHGKSYLLQQIEEDIFNKDLNPDCDDYILLRCNYEMTVFKLLLRRLKRELKTSMKKLIFNKPTGESVAEFARIINEEKNPNIYVDEDPVDPDTWYAQVREFLLTHSIKKHVVITIDHIALVKSILGDKKKAMDLMMEHLHKLKKEYTNVSFIILSQLNRNIEARTDVRFLMPSKQDIFNSDTVYQGADIVMATHNPYKLGHHKYMVVPGPNYSDTYAHLKPYMTTPDNKSTNFITEGVIFHHFLKIRDDDEDTLPLHIVPLDFQKKKIPTPEGLTRLSDVVDMDLFD